MQNPFNNASIREAISSLWTQLHAATLTPLFGMDSETRENKMSPDFKDWLHGDPSTTINPASHYAEDAPGYLTSNGRGSLEVGAAKD